MEEIRVLLVDDNAELRRTLQEQLNKQEGLHVIGECANGLEALEALGKSRVDVMVLDIIMPQMDGYALMEELRRQQPERMPRIIVATALGRDDFVMRAVELGAKYYMIKPLRHRRWWRGFERLRGRRAVERSFSWVRCSMRRRWMRSYRACS